MNEAVVSFLSELGREISKRFDDPLDVQFYFSTNRCVNPTFQLNSLPPFHETFLENPTCRHSSWFLGDRL